MPPPLGSFALPARNVKRTCVLEAGPVRGVEPSVSKMRAVRVTVAPTCTVSTSSSTSRIGSGPAATTFVAGQAADPRAPSSGDCGEGEASAP